MSASRGDATGAPSQARTRGDGDYTRRVRAPVLGAFGAPVAGEFRDLQPTPGAEVLAALAAGVNRVDLAKASGGFY